MKTRIEASRKGALFLCPKFKIKGGFTVAGENVRAIAAEEAFQRHLKKLSETAATIRKHRAECRAKGVEPSESYEKELLRSVGVRI